MNNSIESVRMSASVYLHARTTALRTIFDQQHDLFGKEQQGKPQKDILLRKMWESARKYAADAMLRAKDGEVYASPNDKMSRLPVAQNTIALTVDVPDVCMLI